MTENDYRLSATMTSDYDRQLGNHWMRETGRGQPLQRWAAFLFRFPDPVTG